MNLRNALLTFLLAFFPCLLQAQYARWHVDSSATTGAQTGLDWSNAMTDLHAALTASEEGDTIWVAKGTYFPDSANDRRNRFELKSGVRLLGGFTGAESVESQRDWVANLTVLSGDIGAKGDSLDNSFTILYMENPDSSTLLDGFCFRFGQADSLNNAISAKSPGKSGAAIYMMGFDGFVYADIKNCVFEHNYASNHGGAVFVNGGGSGSVAPRFMDCVFGQNTTRRDGGAVYRDGSAWAERVPDFGNCRFQANYSGRYGGGLFFNEAERTDTLHIEGCQFLENKSVSVSAFAGGGAICLYLGRETGSLCQISKSKFLQDNSTNTGQEILVQDFSALYTSYFGIKSCIVKGFQNVLLNTSNPVLFSLPLYRFNGALNKSTLCRIDGINIETSNVCASFAIDSDIFEFNNATILSNFDIPILNGGPNNAYQNVRFDNIQPTKPDFVFGITEFAIFKLINVFIVGKKYLKDNSFLGYSDSALPVNFINCAFINNDYSWPTPTNGNTRPAIFQNCLFNTDFTEKSKNFKQSKSVEYHNCSFAVLDTVNIDYWVTVGLGNLIGVDPMLMDTANGDFRLSPCSPLINAGSNLPWQNLSNPVDFDNMPRIQNTTVDIGPYESPALSAAQTPEPKNYCGPLPSGSVAFHLENGCPPYAFQWQNATNNGTDTSGLMAGIYFFTITDQKGKAFYDTITIKGSDPSVMILGVGSICKGDSSGMLTTTVAGAVEPVQYVWNNGATSPALTNLLEGDYIVSIVDGSGCLSTDSARIEEAATTSINDTIIKATGPMNMDGSILLKLISGLPPFSFKWSNGDTTGNNTNLKPGDYALTVTNGIGCTEVFQFTVDYTVGTDAAGLENKPSVQPNPAQGIAQLSWGNYDRWQLFNNLGQLVITIDQSVGNSEIDLSGLKTGVYRYIFINKEGRQVVEKLVVAR